MFLASENIDFTGLAHVFLLGGGEWYCLFSRVKASILSLNTDEQIDILNLRGEKERISAIDNKTIFPAYHMNKTHWFTLILDDRMNDEEIMKLIDESYKLAK